ncbi:MAG: bifunctional 2-polyprenyl-6-hydroxyphenol methylase/3-demethylubiquinol 3-O-methyltransferase UbiG [Alphaproteobacteria bacterium]
MAGKTRNDPTIYNTAAEQWWSDEIRWVRTLKNLVPARLRWFEAHVQWPGKSVLDLGCAGGFMAEAMAAEGAHVTGIDPAERALEAARAHAGQSGYDIRYDVGVGESLPYDDGVFDYVVCVDVLEHVSDLQQVLAEINRVLKPGGLFLYDTINRTLAARLAAITVAEDVLRILPQGTHDPDLFIKPSEMAKTLKTVGLTPGPMQGLGPRGINLRGDLIFGTVPLKAVIYMGVASKSADP